jgi:hypothetical protein
MVVHPPPPSKFPPGKFPSKTCPCFYVALYLIATVYLVITLSFLGNKNENASSPASSPGTLRKYIFAVTLIICRLPDILEALVEWKYESAEGKTTGSNFSILHTKNFRLKSVAERTRTGSNGRVYAENQLRTVCNTSSIFYNHGRG